MKRRKGRILIVLLALTALMVGSSSTVCAQGTAADKEKTPASPEAGADQKKVSTADRTPVYKPPLRGSPAAAWAGEHEAYPWKLLFSLSVLVPDHVGLTLQSQPPLYWFISRKPTQPIEFTLTEKDAVKPLLEARLKPWKKPASSAFVWRTTGFNSGRTFSTNGSWP